MATIQTQSDQTDSLIPDDVEISHIVKKEQQLVEKLNSEETYVIKFFKDGNMEDAYEGVLDFSTPEGKSEFNLLKKLISKNNWLVIPENLFQEYETGRVSVQNLEEAIFKNHEKLNLTKPNFVIANTTKPTNDFISDVNDVQASKEVNDLTANTANTSGIVNGEAVSVKPSDILSSFDISVKHKLNELNYYKAKLGKNKSISLKSIGIIGGALFIGAVFSPLTVLTTTVAMGVGGYAILKGLFGKSSEIKNYDKQIELLKEATATMVLKRSGEDTKENIRSFIKNNTSLTSTLFDEKIEAEFARLCKTRNVKVSTNVFKEAYKYANGHILDYNRDAKKPKM